MSSTNRGTERNHLDDYQTPLAPIHALLNNVFDMPHLSFHEPCRGVGNIYNSVECEHKTHCEITEGIDYLTYLPAHRYDLIITNPPFSLAMEFLQKSLAEADTVIYLLRLNFLGSKKRQAFWFANRPSHVLVLSSRPSFTGDGHTDSIEYAWFCWDRAHIVGLEPGVHVL